MTMNDRIAGACARGVGTMWAVYIFLGLSVVGFPYGTHSAALVVQWLSTTCLQLVMLPLLAVGQRVLAAAHSDHAEKIDDLHAKIDEMAAG